MVLINSSQIKYTMSEITLSNSSIYNTKSIRKKLQPNTMKKAVKKLSTGTAKKEKKVCTTNKTPCTVEKRTIVQITE